MKDKIRVIHFNHYDLDAAGCAIMISNAFDVVARYDQNYDKIPARIIEAVENRGDVDTLVITDVMLEESDLQYARDNFKRVVYIDHHQESKRFGAIKDPNFFFVFDEHKCATRLCYETFRLGNKGCSLHLMSNMIDAYDLWQVDLPAFGASVKLNDLMWHIGLNEFIKYFSDGIRNVTDEHQKYISIVTNERNTALDEAVVYEIESGSKIVMLDSASAINFVPMHFDGDMFYILYSDRNGFPRVSGRVSRESDLDIKFPATILSAGGHKKAAGINFKGAHTFNSITEFIEENIDPLMRESNGKN